MSESPAIPDELSLSSPLLQRVKNGLDTFTRMLAPTAVATDTPMGEQPRSKEEESWGVVQGIIERKAV